MSKGNITGELRDLFNAIRNPDYGNFALVSCFVNGEPSAAICAVGKNEETKEWIIGPLFVAVTPGMHLTDHEGKMPHVKESEK